MTEGQLKLPGIPEHGEAIKIRCQLLPASLWLPISILLISLSGVSWLLTHGTGAWSLVSFIVGMVWIPIIMGATMRLKIEVWPFGVKARSRLHAQTLFSRGVRSWTDLHSVRLRKFKSADFLLERLGRNQEGRLVPPSRRMRLLRYLGKGWLQQGFLMLDFKSGGSIPFPLAGFSPTDLDNLFIALARWADPMTLNPDVISLQRDVLSGTSVNIASSYTRMWEESLRQRFEATNFVPLVGGQELQNGRLKVLLLLACGGQSSVYLATDSSGARFVLKELTAAVDDSQTLVKLHELFAREAAILAKLDHANIVKILDSFVENDRDYLLLNFVNGISLRQHVEMHGPFSEHEVMQIARTIADILVYLHGQVPAVIHRDLTPDNFVVREYDREVVLIDFGAANEFVAKVTGTMIGKQCYIPPEQFRGYSVPQSDLYALGATLFYLLTGKDPTPISMSSPREIMPSVSEHMDTIVRRLTAIEPEHRIQTAVDLAQLLRGVPQLSGKAP